MRAAALALLLVAAAKFPAFTAPVVDAAGVVPTGVQEQLNASLEDYQRRSGNQIAVAVVKNTDGESLENYSIDLARKWGVGQNGKDNGVLLLVVWDEHKLRIEVGRGLEGQLTDLQSGRIIREQIAPRLQAGDVGGAITAGTDEIRRALGDTAVGEPTPVTAPPEQPVPKGVSVGFLLLPFLFVLLGLGLVGGRRRRRGFWGFPIFWGGGWGGWGGGGFGAGGGFGGGGGGGFGGGGGGSFGGGGASGGW